MKNDGGFGLIELVVALTGLLILLAMLVATVPIFGSTCGGSPYNEAKGDIAAYGTAVDLYALDHNNEYPRTLQDLVTGDRNYVKKVRSDPWGNSYNYVPPTSIKEANYEVTSSGPDGIGGNEDDVTRTSVHEERTNTWRWWLP